MKVYIILDESNSLGVGTFVEKVFSDKEKAIDYAKSLLKQELNVLICSHNPICRSCLVS